MRIIKKTIQNIIWVLSGLQIIFPLLAFLYLLAWCLRFMNPSWFEALNKWLCFLPNIIDLLFYQTSDILGEEVPMGYVYSSVLCLLLTFLCTFLVNKIDKLSRQADFLRKTKEIRKDIEEKSKIAQNLERKIASIDRFCGLIEFRLSKQDDFFKDAKEMTELKKEFSKLAAKKLKEKYPSLKMSVGDRIFFICNNFSQFNGLVNDVAKIFKLLSKLTYEKDITLELIFSNYANIYHEDNSKVLEILSNINKLSFFNKIVVTDMVKKRYEYSKEIRFSFVPLGDSMLCLNNVEDLGVELYYLKNT